VPLFDCDEGEVSPLCSFGFVVNTTWFFQVSTCCHTAVESRPGWVMGEAMRNLRPKTPLFEVGCEYERLKFTLELLGVK
jgi:hypothetical protein